MSQEQNTKIPKAEVEFAKDVARLAAKYRLGKFGLTFTPAYESEWRDQISVNWESGRHGDSMQNLRIFSTVTVFTKVDAP